MQFEPVIHQTDGDRPLRILIIVHGYPPQQTGGAERRAARTAGVLSRRGHEVRVLTVGSQVDLPDHLDWDDAEQDGVLVRRIELGFPTDRSGFQASYDNPLSERAVEALLADWRPDLAHLFSGYLMSASIVSAVKRLDIPLVISLTDYWWFCHRITLTRTSGEICSGPEPAQCARCQAEAYRRFRVPARIAPAAADAVWSRADRWQQLGARLGKPAQIERAKQLTMMLRQADALVAPSHFLADFYVQHGAPLERLVVQRQGVELTSCIPRKPSDTLRIGYLGQIKHHKGVDILLDAWIQLTGDRPRSLTLYGASTGEADYGNRITKRVARDPRISWPGEYRGNEVWRILSELDVIVVPSRWVENSPNTILEAQAVGVPVVGSNLGGVAELIDHDRNGLLFEAGSAVDLSRQLQRLIDEANLVDHLRQHRLPARSVAQEVDDLTAVYQRCVDTSTSRLASQQPS